MAEMNSTIQNTFITIRCVTPSAHLTASLRSTTLTPLVDQLSGGRPFCFLILHGGEPLILAPGQQQAQGQHQNRIKWALPFPIHFILQESHWLGFGTTQ